MFVFDFVFGNVMNEIVNWIYGHMVGALAEFFSFMASMGSTLFEIEFVASIVLFFNYLGWALFVVGIVVSIFETAIEYQSGRGNISASGINIIKGFMATSLFSVLPIELYKSTIDLQTSLTTGITGHDQSLSDLGNSIFSSFTSVEDVFSLSSMAESSVAMANITNPFLWIFIIIMMGYAVVKVFFANLKIGGIMLIQICVGSFYMFSVPRGYNDGFISWCKQIIGLCLTNFLQITILTAGLMVIKDNCIIGLGLMFSAGEVPRVAGAFGLDTSTKANVSGAVHTTNMLVNITKSVAKIGA